VVSRLVAGMSDGPRIIRPFEQIPKSNEIAYNAARWGAAAKKELPRSIGFIMVIFPKGAIGQARGVAVANVNDEAVKDELRACVKRWGEQRKIITPEDM
jgi:hypothetical protein